MKYTSSTSFSYNSTENIWTLRKTKSSIELDFNGELAVQLYFSNFEEKCEEFNGTRNINWLTPTIWTNAADLQYKSHLHGLQILMNLEHLFYTEPYRNGHVTEPYRNGHVLFGGSSHS